MHGRLMSFALAEMKNSEVYNNLLNKVFTMQIMSVNIADHL